MFKIVQTLEKGVNELTIVPSAWENKNILYWPKRKADKLIKVADSTPEEGWLTMNCKLKRQNLSYSDAEEELDSMLERGDETEKDEEPKVIKKNKRPRVLLPKENINEENNFNYIAEDCLMLQENKNMFISEASVAENGYIVVNNNNESSTFTLSETDNTMIHKKLDNVTENQKKIINNQEQSLQNQLGIMQQLAKLETMLDIVGGKNATSCSCEKKNRDENCEEPGTVMEPIDTLEDLLRLEEQLSDVTVANNLVKIFSCICGRKGTGSGIDNSYILIDRIFTRKFMTLCSWAGGAKDGQEKIPFKIYKNTIRFFFQVIRLSDQDFTLQKCEEFLKNVIRNSKRRNESTMVRISKSKKRPSQLTYRAKGHHTEAVIIDGEEEQQ